MEIAHNGKVWDTERSIGVKACFHLRVLPRFQPVPFKIRVIEYRWSKILAGIAPPLHKLLYLHPTYLAGLPCGNIIHHHRQIGYRPIYPVPYL